MDNKLYKHTVEGKDDMPAHIKSALTNNQITLSIKDKKLMLASGAQVKYDILISTVPLYALMEMCHIEQKRPFQYRPIFVRIEDRPLEAPYGEDIWYVNYLSDPDIGPYRFTDREGFRHYEGLSTMGKIPTRKIVPGKIFPNPTTQLILEHFEEQ